ncbi:lysosomal alpha-glucosidase [Acyrthosiphon pisum]|uniref:P-type domain-containing protein n=1 Tax=Acyrthosiphon pisum TaxID=7029 RepID=A0A8R2NTN8_ACYPI|nr:lysosomal alpha-glucosidase [Acyrthosiphon pisum]|eukprot:XP_001952639.3 PREDICTED: lysosomal alpha-glucosidase [Acyrthosiphon pisum]
MHLKYNNIKVFIILFLQLLFLLHMYYSHSIPNELKFDCIPKGKSDEVTCKKMNCSWTPANQSFTRWPWCYYPECYNNYNTINISKTSTGVVAFYNLSVASSYKKNIQILRLDVIFETPQRLRITIDDAVQIRYKPPFPKINEFKGNPIHGNNSLIISDLVVRLAKNGVGFAIIRKVDDTILFDSRNIGGFIFSDQFIQLSALLPSKYIYGLGEHRTNLVLDSNWKTYTMFNHDNTPKPDINGYGSHPFYLSMEKSGKSHGVFLFNSNAMDIILQPAPAITYRVIGGILDFYFFSGPTPSDVITQYTEIIGRPFLPPYWSLGFHLSRYGQTFEDLIQVYNRTIEAGIPWDTHWNDIDYMDNKDDFTLSNNFKQLPEYVNNLHKNGMHHIVILDPGLKSRQSNGTMYVPLKDGLNDNIFIKNSAGQPLEGKVWNDIGTVFPDFTHPKATQFWKNQLLNFHNIVKFDGLWLDMNEPANFVNGDLNGCSSYKSDHWEVPPYIPGIVGGRLNYKTICMSAIHFAGIHYNLHNLYGLVETISTHDALSEIKNTRPFVISRSSYPGFGHYAGHWTGDINSSWDDMKQSITDIINFNLFGIPLVGADICGFHHDTTIELCSRWIQLGAFYPFSRNHNGQYMKDQDPAALGSNVLSSAKKSLITRYYLLPYLYSLFWKAHVYGETVVRPLFFEYPYDDNTYGIDTQFLWGAALLILPVLKEKNHHVYVYLPKDIWYDFYNKTAILSNGNHFVITAPADTIPLLVRGGFILPTQMAASTTTLSRQNHFELLVATKHDQATGFLFFDDGKSLDSWKNDSYNKVQFKLVNTTFSSIVEMNSYIDDNFVLQNITVLGVKQGPTNSQVNGVPFNGYYFNKTEQVLYFKMLNLNLRMPFNLTW